MPNYFFLPFIASSFMEPYLHQFSAVVQKIWCYLGQICIIFFANLTSRIENFMSYLQTFQQSLLGIFRAPQLFLYAFSNTLPLDSIEAFLETPCIFKENTVNIKFKYYAINFIVVSCFIDSGVSSSKIITKEWFLCEN